MSSENKKKTKEDLEKKIVELEGKLSNLSNMLGKESTSPIQAKKHPPPAPPPPPERPLVRISEASRDWRNDNLSETKNLLEDYEKNYLKRFEELDPDDLDPDGSAKRQLLAIARENSLKHDTRGTMPKGFGVNTKSPFSLIMSYDKKNAKGILKSKRCLGCKKFLDKQHVILCHDCANKMTEQEFKQVLRRFTTWGFYKKSFLTNIALRLKLAKVITEEKNE